VPDAPVTPLPIPAPELARARAILLVGGSFDPPHVGHVRIPAALRAAAYPDGPCAGPVWLVYVPAAQSPLKAHLTAAPAPDRVAMTRLAIAPIPCACVWTDEIDRAAHQFAAQQLVSQQSADQPPAPSYTVDTLRRARAWLNTHAPHVALRLVIGADQAAAFHKWREPREIIRLAEPLVMPRKGVAQTRRILTDIHASGFWTPDEITAWHTRIPTLRDPGVEISSTQLRAALAAGEAPGPMLDPAVGEYIVAHKLYRPTDASAAR